jgi:hypothetical protein
MITAGYILAGLVLVVIVLGASQILGPRCGKYRVIDDSIELVMFGKLRVWRCSFEDISEIQLISFARSFIIPALHLMNRPFGQYVLLRRRRGVFRAVLITPDQPEEFVEIVRRKTAIRTTTTAFS